MFRAYALMFGQTAAVYAFLRISRALSALASRFFSLVVEFLDDFSQFESSALGESSMLTIEAMLELLGWEVSSTETKRMQAAESFNSLGVRLDFSRTRKEEIVVFNRRED